MHASDCFEKLFLERTICCKVKTERDPFLVASQFLERTICCKVKTGFDCAHSWNEIFRKNNLL